MDKKQYLSDYPELMREWDYSKNVGMIPQRIRHRSKTKVWWKCEEGHEWQASVGNRTNGSNCPACSALAGAHRRMQQWVVLAGALADRNPQLAAEWHPTKNGTLTPQEVTASSNKNVWWRCEKGHEWQATIANRNNNASVCPYCSGRRTIVGINDLETVAPKLAAEWHPTRNGSLRPADVKAGSNKKVWWKCSEGHEWQAEIKGRNWGNSCPVCARMENKKILQKQEHDPCIENEYVMKN